MMQVRICADITNDGNESVLILAGYVKGTKPTLPMLSRIDIPPGATIMGENINLMVAPLVGEGGKDLVGRVILMDQFKREHATDEITFTWMGSTEPPSSQMVGKST